MWPIDQAELGDYDPVPAIEIAVQSRCQNTPPRGKRSNRRRLGRSDLQQYPRIWGQMPPHTAKIAR